MPPPPPRTVFIEMGVMRDDLVIFRHPMLCVIGRKPGGLLPAFWERFRNFVDIDDQVPNTLLFKVWRRDPRRPSFAVTR